MSERLVKWRLFFVWQDDQEERWLEEMARQGWHLVKGGIRFVFEKGEPAEVRYRMDYRRQFPGGKGEYISLYKDSGWEYLCEFKSWHYFRSPAAANAPEIYTDPESRIEMYRQLQRVLVVVLICNVVIIGNISARGRSGIVQGLVFTVICLLAYGVWRLGARMKKLRAIGVR